MQVANIKPKQLKPIPWGWINKTTDQGLTYVSKHLGKIRMPSLCNYFDWQKYEIICGSGNNQILATQDMKSIFTTAARFLGYSKLLEEQPPLDSITNEFLKWNERLLRKFPSIQLFIIGDDIAGNRGLMLSPSNWQVYLKPQLKKLIDLGLDYNCKVIYHSDGDINVIIDDLVELNVDGINFQPVGRMKDRVTMDEYRKVALYQNPNPWEGLFCE